MGLEVKKREAFKIFFRSSSTFRLDQIIDYIGSFHFILTVITKIFLLKLLKFLCVHTNNNYLTSVATIRLFDVVFAVFAI